MPEAEHNIAEGLIIMDVSRAQLDDLFKSNGELKRPIKLSPFFLRPAFQYTSMEIRNHQREEMEQNKDKLTVDENDQK